jgi:glutathione S-transferase
MIKIYGANISRAQRCLWMLNELELPYEHIAVGFGGESKAPEYMALNPNGRVPTLVDGELVLWESFAINLYLAKKYPSALSPRDVIEEAHALKWSFWVVTECEHAAIDLMFHNRFLPEGQRDLALVAQAQQTLARPLPVLEAALQDRQYLIADRFTVADLNVAAALGPAKIGRYDLAPFPNIDRWLRACVARPAMKKASGR